MINRTNSLIRAIVLVSILAALVAACGGGESSGNTGGSIPQAQIFQGGPSGGVIIDSQNEITIETLEGAASQEFQISIMKSQNSFETVELLGGQILPSVGSAFEIEINLLDGLGLAAIVTVPYDVRNAPDPLRVGIVFLDELTGKWASVDVIRINPIGGTVTFLTSHFSTWMPVYYPSFPSSRVSIETGFTPEINGFPFSNSLPPPYDVIPRPGRFDIRQDIRGNCTGMSALALRFFMQRLPSTGEGLYSYVNRGVNVRNALYFPIYEGLNIASRTGNGVVYTTLRGSFLSNSIADRGMASRIRRALQARNEPVLLTILSRGVDSHMVVVYRYSENANGTGQFHYYDPNFPFAANSDSWEKSFSHLADGSVLAFDFSPNAIPIIAEELFVSSGSYTASTPRDAERIFNRYFVAGACLTSIPPSGTLPFLGRVCVDNGSCPSNQVLQLIGGNNSAVPPIPRMSSCVPR